MGQGMQGMQRSRGLSVMHRAAALRGEVLAEPEVRFRAVSPLPPASMCTSNRLPPTALVLREMGPRWAHKP